MTHAVVDPPKEHPPITGATARLGAAAKLLHAFAGGKLQLLAACRSGFERGPIPDSLVRVRCEGRPWFGPVADVVAGVVEGAGEIDTLCAAAPWQLCLSGGRVLAAALSVLSCQEDPGRRGCGGCAKGEEVWRDEPSSPRLRNHQHFWLGPRGRWQ
jgi:hypothetical protein